MAGKPWKADRLYFYLFNVERGLCAFIRTPDEYGIVYDLGASEDFSPAEFIVDEFMPYLGFYPEEVASGGGTSIREYKIGQLFISHPHADHISDVAKVKLEHDKNNLHPKLLTCPYNKEGGEPEAFDFETMGDAKDTEELKHYRALTSKRTPPLQVLDPHGIPGGAKFSYGLYYMRPPMIAEEIAEDGQAYINGSSLCVFVYYAGRSILLPGDLTPEVFSLILKGAKGVEKRYYSGENWYEKGWHQKTSNQPTLGGLLKAYGLTVLVAPHHGLESAYSTELFKAMKGEKPAFTIISEKRKSGDETEGKVDSRYQSGDGAEGVQVDVDGELRDQFSLSTRSGYNFAVVFCADGSASYYARSSPEELLEIS